MSRAWISGLLILISGMAWGLDKPPAVPPSILLVTFDTLRADRLGCYGYAAAETPHLDSLSRRGVLFEEARSHVPLTLPSHASILTGLLPPRHGVRGNGLFRLPDGSPTLASVLRFRGYRTAAVVSSVVLDRSYGLDRGFEVYDDNQRVGEKTAFDYLERGASQVADATARELSRLEPPFLLWVHLYDPHRPWIPPEAYRRRHAGRLYDAEVAFADAAFGRILKDAEARARGHLIVAATSDHGESLGEHGENQHGYSLHRGVLRVPLILAGGLLPAGARVTRTVGLIDLAPTLADLAGAPIAGADGSSLGHHWAGAASPALRDMWEESLHPLYDSGWAPLRGLLTDRWHFVEAPRPELYDRLTDPDDRKDLAKERPDLVAELRERLARTGAAMGDVPEPPVEAPESPMDAEQRARLASLGYLTSGTSRPGRGARLDPKDGLPGFLAVETAAGLVEEGKAKQAKELLEPFTKRDPHNPRIWHQLGQAQAASGHLDAASSALLKALALDPRSEFIRYSYAELMKKKGDVMGQKMQLEAILASNPRAAEAALILAALAASAGDVRGSEAILKASYEAGVRDSDLLDRLAHHMQQSGRSGEAVRFFEEALELRPEDPVALLQLGRASLQAGDARSAIDLLTRCTTGPRAFECRIELARAYVVGPGDHAAARRQLQSAREAATDEAMRREVDRRLAALDAMNSLNR